MIEVMPGDLVIQLRRQIGKHDVGTFAQVSLIIPHGGNYDDACQFVLDDGTRVPESAAEVVLKIGAAREVLEQFKRRRSSSGGTPLVRSYRAAAKRVSFADIPPSGLKLDIATAREVLEQFKRAWPDTERYRLVVATLTALEGAAREFGEVDNQYGAYADTDKRLDDEKRAERRSVRVGLQASALEYSAALVRSIGNQAHAEIAAYLEDLANELESNHE